VSVQTIEYVFNIIKALLNSRSTLSVARTTIGVRGGGSGRGVASKILGQTLLFRASAKLLKNPECKNTLNAMKISEQTLFFSTSQSCSKILNDERYFNTVKISGQLCFLGQAKVAEKS